MQPFVPIFLPLLQHERNVEVYRKMKNCFTLNLQANSNKMEMKRNYTAPQVGTHVVELEEGIAQVSVKASAENDKPEVYEWQDGGDETIFQDAF